MTGLNNKVKQDLALLYEYKEFAALEKWNEWKSDIIAEQLLSLDMSQPGASERVSMLQGQALAHKVMLLELKKIHKENQLND